MLHLFRSLANLLGGHALLATAYGFLGTLLSVRLSLEGYSETVSGNILACFYVGLIAGSFLAKSFIASIGHIRYLYVIIIGFALAAVAHSLVVDPFAWGALRIVSGFCMAGSFVTFESWLNAKANNQQRGTFLAIYMLTAYLSIGGGQKLITVADIGDDILFFLAGGIATLALVPVMLTRKAERPARPEPEKIGLSALMSTPRLGMIGATVSGILLGSFYSMMPRYGVEVGLDAEGVSTLMLCGFFGAMVFQIPVGKLSDRINRRHVILAVSLLLTGLSIVLTAITATSPDSSTFSGLTFLSVVFVFSGMLFVAFPLSISYSNDRAAPSKLAATAGAMNLFNAIGCMAGTLLVAKAMEITGPLGFFIFIAACGVFMSVVCLVQKDDCHRAAADTPHGDVMAAKPITMHRTVPAGLEEAGQRRRNVG
ncbi:MFS transporter [Haematospirillum sp. H1815]|uniref:MFS transporter n=1 Tax=Haematospirillum sp. H1815 TaxID=2723108 RepID=UPI00143B6EDB|nr:MFS transporter [Haematospirillum sp. H1815]NKD77512.1 MFS transporter [Haematospirillum sp. H1815]